MIGGIYLKYIKILAKSSISNTNKEKEHYINLDQITYLEVDDCSVRIFFSNGNKLDKSFKTRESDEKGNLTTVPRPYNEVKKEIKEFLKKLEIEIVE